MSALAGRQVAITGGDGALGHAVVQAFVRAGASCHLPVLGDPPGSAPPGAKVTGQVNLSDETAVRSYFAGLPGLWASIHLAGGYLARPVTDTTQGFSRAGVTPRAAAIRASA